MAADPVTGFDPDTDEQLKQDLNGMDAAGDQAKSEAATAAFAKAAPTAQPDEPGYLQHFVTDLPQNVGSGLINMALNAADQLHSAARWGSRKVMEAQEAMGGKPADIAQMEQDATSEPDSEGVKTPEYDEIRSQIQEFNQKYVAVKDPTFSDGVVQSFAQFAIPYAGWSKAVSYVGGAGKLAAAGKMLLTEAATGATSMSPHADGPGEGRFSDMIAVGKQTENKFTDALNALFPDGSMQNEFINYLHSRDEGPIEGRVKNALDAVVGGTVLSPLIQGGFKMLKGGMNGLQYAVDNGVGSAGSLGVPNQEGRIGYHGTPHDFNVDAGFDDSKIGSGEGKQVFGYGHYLAEVPGVAKQYQGSLAARAAPENLVAAQKLVSDAGGDKVKAYTQLGTKIDNETSLVARGKMIRMQQMIKNGAVDKGKGSFITADVDDGLVSNMLDHDRPMSEQQSVLDKLPTDDVAKLKERLQDYYPDGNGDLGSYKGGQFRQLLERTIGEGDIHTPDMMDQNIPRQASQYLDSHGVPGIKFLDGNSRSGGEGTRNLAVFNGKNIKVLKKE